MKRTVFFSFFVALAVWVLNLCVVPPTHACCGSAVQKLDAAAPCCLGQPVATASAIPPASDPPVPMASAAAERDWLDSIPTTQNFQSFLGQKYIKNQRGRYLELRVLLN